MRCPHCKNNLPEDMPKSASGYRGVTYVKAKGKRYIRAMISNELIGNFKTIEEAARAYDDEARVRFGKKAKLNFPDDAA